MEELEEARDKVRWGRERRSLAMTDEDKKFTAWHEAGHALVNVMLQHTHPLHKVTIIPRGQSLGSTMSLPKTDILNRRRKEMLDMIAVMMAGRIAEEIVSGDISSGAAGDIQQATNMARAMVTQWGMSDRLGMVQYGDDDEYVFLGREMARAKVYSEFTAQEIDAEVKRIIDDAYKTAKDILDGQPRQAGADCQVAARIRDARRRSRWRRLSARASSLRRRRRRRSRLRGARRPAHRCPRHRPNPRRRSCPGWARRHRPRHKACPPGLRDPHVLWLTSSSPALIARLPSSATNSGAVVKSSVRPATRNSWCRRSRRSLRQALRLMSR